MTNRREIAGINAVRLCISRLSELNEGMSVPLRWIITLLVLAAEIASIKLRYSSGTVQGGDSLGAWLMRHSSYPLSLAITIIATTVFISGKMLWAELSLASKRIRPLRQALPIFCLHGVFFAGFAFVSRIVFEREQVSSGHGLVWVLCWAGAGAATLVSWCLTSLPLNAWFELTSRCRIAVLRGVAVGAIAAIAGWGTEQLGGILGRATFWTVRTLLNPIYADLAFDPATFTLGTPVFSVVIYPRCSGYEGIGLISAFLACYCWFFRGSLRFPRAFLLFPFGIALVWIANALRLAALVAIGTSISPDLAMGGFHIYSGWLLMIAVSLGVITMAERMRFFKRDECPPSLPHSEINFTGAYLAPLMVVVAAGMLSGALSAGFDYLYPLRVVAAVAVLWIFRKAFFEIRWSLSWQPILIGGVASVIWLALARSAPGQAGLPLQIAGMSFGWASIWFLFRTAGYVITAPVAEELAFRGYLSRRIISADFLNVPISRLSWMSLAVSAGLFAAVHGRNWLPALLAGILFFWAFRRRGRILEAIQAHITTNAVIATYVLITGNWAKWS